MLIITEKPSVAQSFGTALSIPYNKELGYYEKDDTVITNCIGHLYELAKPEEYDEAYKIWSFEMLPIIPHSYIYKKSDDTVKQLNKITVLLKKHRNDRIVIATDADREGEVIARTVFQQAGFTDTTRCVRFWVSEALTPQVINKGLAEAKPWKEYDRLAKQGFARQHADWLVGMNLSPYETLLAGHKITLPVGRVQTAILAAIAQRNNDVKNFKAQPYYQCVANLKDNNGNKVEAYLTNPETKKNIFWEMNFYINKAHQFSELNKGIKVETDTKRKKINPPKLFSLTELQKTAAKEFDYSSSRTLEIAQSLYEKHKCLSYPRTPSNVLGDDDVELFREKYLLLKSKYEISKYCNEELISKENKNIFDSAKLDSHHALIPLDVLPSETTQAEKNIYCLVAERFFMSCMNPCKYDEKNLLIKNGEYEYKTVVRTIVEQGWKEAEKKSAPNGANKDEEEPLQLFDEKTCILKNTEIVKKMTLPKKEFTETSLLAFMENPTMENTDEKLIGLGTPATRGSILSKLEEHKYVEKRNRKYYATDKAYFLLKLLFKNTETSKVASISQTTKWEKQIEESPEKFESYIIGYIKDCVKIRPEIENYEKPAAGICPLCKNKILESQKAFFCTNIKTEPKCQFIINKNAFGAGFDADDLQMMINGKKTKTKSIKSKNGNTYHAKFSLDLKTMEIKQEFINDYKKYKQKK